MRKKGALKQSSEDMGLPCGLEGCSQTVESKGQCSGCKDIHYCCKEHQVKDWKRHKKECKEKAKAGSKEKAAANPPFHEEYKESFPEDHLGFSTLYSRFKKITVLTSPLGKKLVMMMMQGSILDEFGSVESLLSQRWGFDVNQDPIILDFLYKGGHTVGEVWRGHPKLIQSYPYGTSLMFDTLVQTIRMQNMRNTASPKVHLVII